MTVDEAILTLTRRRNEVMQKIEDGESSNPPKDCYYERGVAFGLNVGLSQLEALRVAEEVDRV